MSQEEKARNREEIEEEQRRNGKVPDRGHEGDVEGSDNGDDTVA